jgi:hypothetical protein
MDATTRAPLGYRWRFHAFAELAGAAFFFQPEFCFKVPSPVLNMPKMFPITRLGCVDTAEFRRIIATLYDRHGFRTPKLTVLYTMAASSIVLNATATV